MKTSLKSLSFAWIALAVAMLVATSLPPDGSRVAAAGLHTPTTVPSLSVDKKLQQGLVPVLWTGADIKPGQLCLIVVA
jgi:hypothetical protein